MLTAHLPSGFVLARCLPSDARWVLPAAIIGAVLPDLDMVFFHLVDNRSIHHHRYWVHIPLFWACVAAVTLPVLKWRGLLVPGLAFFAALLVHMILDSIGGGIMWLAPFDSHLYSLVTVPATQSHWVLSFIFHWTFLLELLIWIAAIGLVERKRRT